MFFALRIIQPQTEVKWENLQNRKRWGGDYVENTNFYFRWSRFVNISSDHNLSIDFSRFVVLMSLLLYYYFGKQKSEFSINRAECACFYRDAESFWLQFHFICGGLVYWSPTLICIRKWSSCVWCWRGYENSSGNSMGLVIYNIFQSKVDNRSECDPSFWGMTPLHLEEVAICTGTM